MAHLMIARVTFRKVSRGFARDSSDENGGAAHRSCCARRRLAWQPTGGLSLTPDCSTLKQSGTTPTARRRRPQPQVQVDPSRRSSYARPTEAPPSFVVAILGRPSCLSHRSKAVLRRATTRTATATTRTATATGRQRPRHEDGDCASPTLDDLRTHPRELSMSRLYKSSLRFCSPHQRILLSFA